MNSRDTSRHWRLETLALHGDPALGPTAGAEALPRVDRCAWDQSKCSACDRSNALKRELQSTAKALTPIDRCAWDQSKR